MEEFVITFWVGSAEQSLLPDEGEQLLWIQPPTRVCALEQTARQIPLLMVEGDDLLFDRVLRNEAVDRHWPDLADAVGAVAA